MPRAVAVLEQEKQRRIASQKENAKKNRSRYVSDDYEGDDDNSAN
jgi:hypothetical protein